MGLERSQLIWFRVCVTAILIAPFAQVAIAGEPSSVSYSGHTGEWHAIRFSALGNIRVSMGASGNNFGFEFILYRLDGSPILASEADAKTTPWFQVIANLSGAPPIWTSAPLGSDRDIGTESSVTLTTDSTTDYRLVFFAAGRSTWRASLSADRSLTVVSETSGDSVYFVTSSNLTYANHVKAQAFQAGIDIQSAGEYKFNSPGILVGDIFKDSDASTGSLQLRGPITRACTCHLVEITGPGAAVAGAYTLERDGADLHEVSPPFYMSVASIQLPS